MKYINIIILVYISYYYRPSGSSKHAFQQLRRRVDSPLDGVVEVDVADHACKARYGIAEILNRIVPSDTVLKSLETNRQARFELFRWVFVRLASNKTEQILGNFYFESFAEPILIRFYPFYSCPITSTVGL